MNFFKLFFLIVLIFFLITMQMDTDHQDKKLMKKLKLIQTQIKFGKLLKIT